MSSDSKFCNSVVCFALVLCCVAVGPEHYSEGVYSILSVSSFIFGIMCVVYGSEELIVWLVNFIKQKRGSRNE